MLNSFGDTHEENLIAAKVLEKSGILDAYECI